MKKDVKRGLFMIKDISVVILAGGKGTRISSINKDVPKSMIKLNNKPVLEFQIEFFKNNNLTNIILVVGHLKDIIINHFKDGKEFGVNITYVEEQMPLGTAGCFYYLKNIIKNDNFLLVNGDIIFDINIQKLIEFHNEKEALATICTHPNSHPFDSGLIFAKDGLVYKWLSKEDERKYYKNRVNAGIHILKKEVLDMVNTLGKYDLDRDILKKLIPLKKLYAYDTPEYIKDMGTPERYYQVIEDIKNNKPYLRNLKNKQKAIFLDRDGTINKYVGFLTNIDDFSLNNNVIDAIKLINNSDYLAIVITNQPVVARGEVTFEELEEIHHKMETLLGMGGAYLDDIYYCPHHPDSGFPEEIKELKIKCRCRKPGTLLVEQAVEKYNIDLSLSCVIGDDEKDKLLASNLNIPYYEVNSEYDLLDRVKEILNEKN